MGYLQYNCSFLMGYLQYNCSFHERIVRGTFMDSKIVWCMACFLHSVHVNNVDTPV